MEGDGIVNEVLDSDRDAVIAIFNYFAAASAVYPEMPVSERFGVLTRGNTRVLYPRTQDPCRGFRAHQTGPALSCLCGDGNTHLLHPAGIHGEWAREQTSLTPHVRGKKDGNDVACRKHGFKKYRGYLFSYPSRVY
jgi:hypothetical protein